MQVVGTRTTGRRHDFKKESRNTTKRKVIKSIIKRQLSVPSSVRVSDNKYAMLREYLHSRLQAKTHYQSSNLVESSFQILLC